MKRHTLAEALLGARGGQTVRADAKSILEEHAPEIAALQPNASWHPQVQEAVQNAIEQLPGAGRADTHRARVADAVAHVIAYGQVAGLWTHAPWRASSTPPNARSGITASSQEALERAEADRAWFLEQLPTLLAARAQPTALLYGAALFSAAMVGGLMHAELLSQLGTSRLMRVRNVSWVDLKLGSQKRKKIWKNPRRFFPDEVTGTLMQRLVLPSGMLARCDPNKALAALATEIGITTYSLRTLAHAAKAWWSVRVPSAVITYATQPQLAPSVPPHVLMRVLTGRPLTLKQEASLAAEMGPSAKPDTVDVDGREALRESSRDGVRQQLAVKRLMRSLNRLDRQRVPTPRVLQQRLSRWHEEFGDVGGWVHLMWLWAQHVVQQSKGPRRRILRVPGLKRYLGAFAKRWVMLMYDLPVEAVEERRDELDERLAILAGELQEMNSGHVARVAVASFLQFVSRVGGPLIHCGTEWDELESLSEASANLLTRTEFQRVLVTLDQALPSTTLPGLRAQALAILAYGTGLRWELLQHLRVRDVCWVSGDPQKRGVVMRRPNAHVQGKTRPTGGVTLEHVMPIEHRTVLSKYISQMQSVSGANPDYFIFADPETPHIPSRELLTRDLIQQAMRTATRDPTLRFHHLRHSAANVALVSVMWPRSSQPIPALRVLEGLSARARGVTDSSYAELVTGRTHEDRSRLYAVSQLLGHSTPNSTMRSYIHTMDAVAANQFALHAALPRRLAAKLRGVGVEAIRKAEQRARERERLK